MKILLNLKKWRMFCQKNKLFSEEKNDQKGLKNIHRKRKNNCFCFTTLEYKM